MFTRDLIALALSIAMSASVLAADAPKAPKLGTPMTPEDIAKWDITIFPDGRGLPKGRGTAAEGKAIFDAQCAGCHGANGRGATAEELVGEPKPPTADNPAKTVGGYWPHATTIFDFTRRFMPPQAPGSLSTDQLYAVTAYLLHANGIIGANDVIDAATLPKIQMPNRDGFERIDAK